MNDEYLPPGMTCRKCVNFLRCVRFFKCNPRSNRCDYVPNRFVEKIVSVRVRKGK